MAKDAADNLVGTGQDRADKAWRHVYRSFEHGFAKNACGMVRNLSFSDDIVSCADSFISLQEYRHKADYDPYYTVTRPQAFAFIEQAKQAIEALEKAKHKDRTAFAVQLLLKNRA
jgi:hypothetical protein